MRLEKYKKIVRGASPEKREEVSLSMDILDRLNELLEIKFEGRQKDLATKMQVSEAVVSRWLSGVQNFRISTLAKFSAAFEEPIIQVCSSKTKNHSKKTLGSNANPKQKPQIL